MEVNKLRREHIVWNAIEIINESGIHAFSTKAIAKKLGISEGTIFHYFRRKNDLLLAILEQFSLYDHDIFQTAKRKMNHPREAILFYFDAYMSYYENYPAMTALLQCYDMLQGIEELREKSNTIYCKRIEYTRTLIEEAQATGVIKKEVEVDMLVDILVSTCQGICFKWRVSNFTFSLREKSMQAVVALLDAFGFQKIN